MLLTNLFRKAQDPEWSFSPPAARPTTRHFVPMSSTSSTCPAAWRQVVLTMLAHGSCRSFKGGRHVVSPVSASTCMLTARPCGRRVPRRLRRPNLAVIPQCCPGDNGDPLLGDIDSCHSGGVSRGLGASNREPEPGLRPWKSIAEGPAPLPSGQTAARSHRAEYNPALVFLLRRHRRPRRCRCRRRRPSRIGAFTAALVEALGLAGDAPAAPLDSNVPRPCSRVERPHQEPDLDATPARRQQPSSGTARDRQGRRARRSRRSRRRPARHRPRLRHRARERIHFDAPQQGPHDRLRVTSLEGISRSTAEVLSPSEGLARRDLRVDQMEPGRIGAAACLALPLRGRDSLLQSSRLEPPESRV